MAGTYYRPGRVIDTSISDLTKGVQDVEKALKEEAKLRKIEEQNRINRINKINEGEYGLSSAINEFPEYADVTLDDEIKLGLKNQLEYVHQLGIDSIGKDNSAYLKAKRQLEVAAKEAGLFMASFNEQGALWEERRYVNEDQPSSYLNNTDPGRIVFMDDYVKGGSNIKPELVDGVWMFTKKGEDGGEDFIVNSRAYLNEKNDFIEYTEDIAPIAKTIYDTHAVKYQKEKEKILEKYEGGDGTIITESFEDWDKANIDLRKAISSDPALLKTLNSKTFQSIPSEIRGKESYDPSSEEQKKMYTDYIVNKVMDDFAEEGRTRTALSTDSTRKLKDSNSTNSSTINDEEKSYSDKFIINLKDLKEGKEGSEDAYIGTKLDGASIRKIKRDGDSITFVTQNLDKSGEPTGEPFNQTFNLNNKKQIENLERKLLKQTPKNYDVSVIETYINTKTDELIVGEESFDVDPLISFNDFNKEETNVVKKLEELYPNATFEEAVAGKNAISVKIGDQEAKEFRLSNKADYDKFIKLVDPKYAESDPTKGMTNEERIKYYLANSSK
tara:strand:- start:5524 stop:7191 length:1668 start_codon:yes stop_codon:yes gene_type:complete